MAMNIKRLRANNRSNRGSMFTMTLLCIGLLLVACMVGFALYLFLSEQKRGQTEADKVALDIAKSMNEGDRIGQMNNLVVRCRELVYTSRMMEGTTENSYLYFCQPLAQQLLDEATSSALQVDKERVNQIGLMQKNIRNTVDKYNLETNSKATFRLPWWQSYALQVFQVNGGCLKDVQSNVEHTEIYDDLNDLDKRAKYFQPGSNLYMGNINARLPAPDSSLDFKIASIPAPVDKMVAPARLANPEVFKFGNDFFENGKFVKQSFDQIPSAVQVLGSMDVEVRNNKERVQIGSTALSNGATPLPTANFDSSILTPDGY
jgi:hypothetical protein